MPERACQHQLHLTMVREAAAHMPAMVVHRISDVECGRRDEELHPAIWAVIVPGGHALQRILLCDRHFALFVLDREQFEVQNIPLEGFEEYGGEDGA